jgi:hypothetical protein
MVKLLINNFKERIIMKSQTIIFLGLFSLVSFIFVGCTTKPALYTSLADERNYSSIAFKNTFKIGDANLTFISFDGQSLPKPEKGTHWDPIHFPSGRKLEIVVHADYRPNTKTTLGGFGLMGAIINTVQDVRAATRNVDADLIFVCPPLAAGKNYLLTFTKGPGMPGKNLLTLTDVDTVKVVHQQEFEVVFGGDEVQ